MKIAIGLTTTDLSSLAHNAAILTADGPCTVFRFSGKPEASRISRYDSDSSKEQACRLPASGILKVVYDARTKSPLISAPQKLSLAQNQWLVVRPDKPGSTLTLNSISRSGKSAKYQGDLAIFEQSGRLKLALVIDLDEYLRGVLDSEIPGSYHLEAIKCQAVAARTYALRPRLDHTSDAVNVCDSYLCCQYFGGLSTRITASHSQAILETAGQVLVYGDEPILALFSSSAGGHTESYENCFSDPRTNQFPSEPLPYLKGVPEFIGSAPNMVVDEAYLRRLHGSGIPLTVDQWSHHFKWSVTIASDLLESHLHATVKKMLSDKTVAPFIVPPSSGKFGHVKSFEVAKRGVSGTAIELAINTSDGGWLIRKELVIRDIFRLPKPKPARLKSARLFFDHQRDKLGLLSSLSIKGLGWGHGVGMQQTGAQGWARKGLDYRSILNHYFTTVRIERM